MRGRSPLIISGGSGGCNPLGGPEGRFTSAVKSLANPWRVGGSAGRDFPAKVPDHHDKEVKGV